MRYRFHQEVAERNGNEFVFCPSPSLCCVRAHQYLKHFARRRGKSRRLLAFGRSKLQKSPVLVRKKGTFRLLRRTFYIQAFPGGVRLEPVNGFILWSQPVHRQTICKQCRRSRGSRKEIFPPSPTAAPRRRMGDAIDADSQGRNPAKAR